MGLLFGMPDYRDPISNRKAGYGRFDLQLVPKPESEKHAPLITLEVKFMSAPDYNRMGEEALKALAQQAIAQVEEKAYDAQASSSTIPCLRWGIAFGGKHVAVVGKHG